MTRHIHADHMIAAANDTSIAWQFENLSYGPGWFDCPQAGPNAWYAHFNYRQKPKEKKTVDMWQWAMSSSGGRIFAPEYFYANIEDAQKDRGHLVVLGRIEGSKISVEVEQ